MQQKNKSKGLDGKQSAPRVQHGGTSPLALQRWLPGLLGTEIAAPSSQPHDPPTAFLPVSLNIMLNCRSNGRKQTNNKINQSALLGLVTLSSLFFNLHTSSFFPFFISNRSTVSWRCSCIWYAWQPWDGTGWSQLYKWSKAATIPGFMQQPILGMKNNHCSEIRWDRAMVAWWIFTSVEVTPSQSQDRMYLCGWHQKIDELFRGKEILLWKCRFQSADKGMAQCLGQSYFSPAILRIDLQVLESHRTPYGLSVLGRTFCRLGK